ncbi:MAG: N-acetylmuramoyl-L-alanine amidase [Clostridia bacterium]|nr:N-acetylmuramoyl-L-alanine amidase [Clostridia bacterium]
MNEQKPIIYTLKFLLISLLSAIVIFGIGVTFERLIEKRLENDSLPTYIKANTISVVIDAGHGGEDAGAIAPDGTLEKDLNLEISNLVKALCILNGINVKMTRENDMLLYDYYNDLENYTGQKKVYDLKNRLKIAEEHPSALYVGIHMNKFSQAKYKGTQIYYSKNNEESQLVASDLSKKIKSYLQPENNRQIKGADSSIYILNNIKNPAILVECGFLSNEEELSSLKDEEYRASLALLIFASICEYNS